MRLLSIATLPLQRKWMMADASEDTESIVLPSDALFRNLHNADRFALDIGGSLVKLAYSSRVAKSRSEAQSSQSSTSSVRGNCDAQGNSEIRLHFYKFETKYIDAFLDLIRKKISESTRCHAVADSVVKVTGGGAYKYAELISAKLGLKLDKEDEVSCLIRGCNFLLHNIPDESFTFHHHDKNTYQFQTVDPCHVFPYLLVNIGSGTSIVKVDSEEEFQRIGGSSVGGGTFWGLGSLLTDAKGCDALLSLAEVGDHRNVDTLVGDIYGGSYESLGLSHDLIASSFGRTVRSSQDSGKNEKTFDQKDIARSLLLTISNVIGQIACLYATIYDIKRIYFAGYFIRGHPVTMMSISFAINYWSKGTMSALFLRHEGYPGVIGAFLKGEEESSAPLNHSWKEHLAGSSGFDMSVPAAFRNGPNSDRMAECLEIDRIAKHLAPCHLIRDLATYVPDTVDLLENQEARQYWLSCLEKTAEKTAEKASRCQPDSPDAAERAKAFLYNYLQHLTLLKQRPFAYGCLNVRSLLNLKEQLLNEYCFPDAYYKDRCDENRLALQSFAEYLEHVDSMDWESRQLEVVTGLLAGNVFDWGAQEVVRLMESSALFTFAEAKAKLQKRPWLFDDFGRWLTRLKDSRHPSYRCACVFADNSGFDIVLGVLPFVRELLRSGCKVILSANSRPVLNDVTHEELVTLLSTIAKRCAVIREALENKRLLVIENGQCSPCLDLRHIDGALAKEMVNQEVDLVVLEGMGRAIHTNFNAKFQCDVLKIAVIKNRWLAHRLGGEMFSVVFRFETPQDQL